MWVKPGKVERIPAESNRRRREKMKSGEKGIWEGREKGKDLEEGTHHQGLVGGVTKTLSDNVIGI